MFIITILKVFVIDDTGESKKEVSNRGSSQSLTKLQTPHITPSPVKKIEPVASAKKKAVEAARSLITSTSPTKPSSQSAKAIVSKYVDASRLNVRTGPGKDSKVIWTLKRDEKVRVVRTQGDWSYLEGNRYSGWVFSTYLTKNPGSSIQQKRTKPANKRKKIRKKRSLNTAAIKRILIKRSRAYYSGSCPCPYNITRSGRRCGGNSAWSRPGGASPLCYPSDITTKMVQQYRSREG